MSKNENGGGGCFLVPVAAITIVLGVALWAGFGWDPKDAAITGLQWGFGLVCCLAPTVVAGLLAALFVVNIAAADVK
jgi:hypothetical protein